jgi:hypothetical protein
MKVKSRVLLGLILLIVLVGGYSIINQLSEMEDIFNPSDVYACLGDTKTGGFSNVSYASGSAGADAPVGVASSMPSHGAAFSYARAVSAPVGAMGSTSAYSQVPMAGGQGLYTTSSAELRSFGGGGNGGGSVSMSGGVAKSSGSGAGSSVSVGVSSSGTPVLAVNNNRNTNNQILPNISGEVVANPVATYAGIGNTTKGVAGRKNVPGIGGEWAGWLDTEWSGGSNDITFDMLKDLYARMTGDTDFSNQELWDAFLAWFEGNQSNDKFGWYWAPISDAVPFVLLLCLVYAFVIYRKTKMAKNVKAEK